MYTPISEYGESLVASRRQSSCPKPLTLLPRPMLQQSHPPRHPSDLGGGQGPLRHVRGVWKGVSMARAKKGGAAALFTLPSSFNLKNFCMRPIRCGLPLGDGPLA